MDDPLMILPPADPPSGIWWRENFERDEWRFRVRPGFGPRHVIWLIAVLGIAALAMLCLSPSVVVCGILAAVGYFVRSAPPNELTLGPDGFSFVGRVTIENLATIARFDTIVDRVDGGPDVITLARAIVHDGPPIAFMLDGLDHRKVTFVAARLNAALHQIRETRGYRG